MPKGPFCLDGSASKQQDDICTAQPETEKCGKFPVNANNDIFDNDSICMMDC